MHAQFPDVDLDDDDLVDECVCLKTCQEETRSLSEALNQITLVDKCLQTFTALSQYGNKSTQDNAHKQAGADSNKDDVILQLHSPAENDT